MSMNASLSKDKELARYNMVEQQIRPWNVLDTDVLALFSSIPREEFVPAEFIEFAFQDIDIPLSLNGHETGENMLSPKLEARLLQSLELKKSDVVLEVGTGSGFQAAIIAALAHQVISVEINPKLVEFARQNILRQKIQNVHIENADGLHGFGSTEYDAILLTGSVTEIADSLKYQLRVGGRLVAAVGTLPMMKVLRITRTSASEFTEESLFDTVIKPLRGVSPSRFKF